MKHLFTLLMAVVLAFSANAQGYTAPIKYGNGVPTAAPSNNGSGYYRNNLTGTLYEWNQSAWQVLPLGFVQISGTGAPMFSPSYGQSNLAINGDPLKPKMYKYVGPGATDWLCLNCVEVLNVAEGDGILIAGTAPDITISAVDPSAANELNTSLAVSGSNLVLVDPGNTLSVPVATIAPVQNVVAGTGISVGVSGNTYTITNTSPNTDAQTLALAGRSLSISGGNSVTLPNDLQTLSLSGDDLTLSGGGGTVTIPGDGNGIYGGSGSVKTGTIATSDDGGGLTSGLSFGGVTTPVSGFPFTGVWGEYGSELATMGFYQEGSLLFSAEFTSGASNFTQNWFSGGMNMETQGSRLEFGPDGVHLLSSSGPNTKVFKNSATTAAVLSAPENLTTVEAVEQMLTGGGGIYGGSGDVTAGTYAELDGQGVGLFFANNFNAEEDIPGVGFKAGDLVAGLTSDGFFRMHDRVTYSNYFLAGPGQVFFTDGGAARLSVQTDLVSLLNGFGGLEFLDGLLRLTDHNTLKKGLQYAGDYSTGVLANTRSIPDVGTVGKMLGSGATVTGATSALANAAAITAGLATGDPYRWDDGTAIHLMFRK